MTAAEIETVELIETWLYSTLSADSALYALVNGNFEGTIGVGGESLSVPKVSFSYASSRDITNQTGDIIMVNSLYNVKAIVQGTSWDVAKPIARRIHQLIHKPGTTHSVTGGGSISCTREMILQYPEVDAGQEYRHLGGMYRIHASRDA